MSLAKKYLIFFGVYHLSHLLSLIGVYESIAEAPPILSIWWWHLVLLLVYGALPIVHVYRGNEYTRLAVIITCTAGILVEMFKVFTWTGDIYMLYLVLALMDFFAAAAAVIDKF